MKIRSNTHTLQTNIIPAALRQLFSNIPHVFKPCYSIFSGAYFSQTIKKNKKNENPNYDVSFKTLAKKQLNFLGISQSELFLFFVFVYNYNSTFYFL